MAFAPEVHALCSKFLNSSGENGRCLSWTESSFRSGEIDNMVKKQKVNSQILKEGTT